MLQKLKSMKALVCALVLGMVASASAAVDTAQLNSTLRDVAGSLDTIASSVSTIIAPAMIGLTIMLTILVIVVKICKKPRSAG